MQTRRYLCPKHRENTPSAVVYGDRYYCFGQGCQGHVSELGVDYDAKNECSSERYIEPLGPSIEFISSLPKRLVRGLLLPVSDDSYYLVWPDHSYYKRRLNRPFSSANKYLSPCGHKKVPFWCNKKNNATLVVIEGEFNALSVFQAYERAEEFDLVSPGGVSDFDKFIRSIDYEYKYILFICDADSAGFKCACESKLLAGGLGFKNVGISLWGTDANDILQKEGAEALRQRTREALEEGLRPIR